MPRSAFTLQDLRTVIVSGLLALAVFTVLSIALREQQFREVRLLVEQKSQLNAMLSNLNQSELILLRLIDLHQSADEVELLGLAEDFYVPFQGFMAIAIERDAVSDMWLAENANPLVIKLRANIVSAVTLFGSGRRDEFRQLYRDSTSELLRKLRKFVDDATYDKSANLRNYYREIGRIESWLTWVSMGIIACILGLFLAAFRHFESLLGSYIEKLKLRNMLVRKVQDEKLALAHQIQTQLETDNTELEMLVEQKTESLSEAVENYKKLNAKLEFYNTQDPLTSLYNRGYFDTEYNSEMRRASGDGQLMSLMMIDIDNFKKINDTYGHLVGDECIRQVASLIRTVVKRETDIVARYGGEEFVALMSGVTDEKANQTAEQIREAVESLVISSHGTEIRLTVSIGLASMIPRPELTSSELLKRADNALYAAKDNGRNKVMFETAA